MSSIAASEPIATDRGKLLGPYGVLRGHRDLALLFSGQVVSAFGDWLYITALIGADLGRAACMIGLLLVCTRERIWLAFPLVFVSTCLFSLFRPALGATLPLVAGSDEDLVHANSLMTQIDGMSLVIGPALVSVLIVLHHATDAFAINAVTYAVSAGTLACLHVRQRAPEASGAAGHWAAETLSGFRHIFRSGDAALAAVTWTTAGLSMFNGALWTLAVVFAERTWHFGSAGTGLLNAAYGLGGLAGGFVASAFLPKRHLRAALLVSLVGSALAIGLFGISPAGIMPFAMLAIFGLGDIVNTVAGNTLIQQRTPNALLGRVFGAFEAIIVGSLLLGALVTGPLIEAVGPRITTVALAGVALAVLTVYAPRLHWGSGHSSLIEEPAALAATIPG